MARKQNKQQYEQKQHLSGETETPQAIGDATDGELVEETTSSDQADGTSENAVQEPPTDDEA